MSHEASLLLEDDISTARHELFKPLNETTTSMDEISAIKDPRAFSVTLPNSLQTNEQLHLPGEQPKTVISRRRKDAFLRSLIHIPAIVITLGALSLSFRAVFWQAPTSYTNTVLNILQFVAKAHEAFIIFSLTAIVFRRLRYEIICQDGIPFGLLSFGLQYSSVTILTRKDFRQVLTSPKQARYYLGTISIVVLAFLLASTSGPSAAVAVLPRLEWWPVRPSPSNPLPVIYLNTRTGSTFPTVVTVDPEMTCNNHSLTASVASTTYNFWCPSNGFDTIMTSGMVQSVMAGDLLLLPSQILMPSYGLSTLGISSTFSRSLNGNLLIDKSGNTTSTVFVASMVPDIVGTALGFFWENQDQTDSLTRPMAKTSSAQNQVVGLQKPIVQVQCTGSFHSMANSTPDMVLLPSTYHSPAPTSNQSWTVPLAGVLANSTFNHSDDQVTFDYPIVYNTFACTINAMWIPSESWIDPTTDDIVHETISNPLQERHHFKEGHGKIQLSRSWLDTLNVLTDLPNTPENATTFQILVDGCKNNASNHTLLEICIQSVVALIVTDGLARMQSTTSQLWLWHGLAEEYFLGATESSYVKYGLRGSKGILIATVILLTYVLVAFINMVVVVIGGWSSNTWSTPGELIALSANSSPTKLLQNTCAGIEDPKTWTRIVSVQETSEAHLEIVFDAEVRRKEDEEIPRDNQSIEMQEGQPNINRLESRVRRRVIPEKRYGTIK
ncbi:hypothetical protein F5882DRAFT_442895 [Hyaloscypha sp. PMI_1271]|nr:hypothetical protein F5882DRAFT_442895 [Hyaloscypha sp. PMI_1271]